MLVRLLHVQDRCDSHHLQVRRILFFLECLDVMLLLLSRVLFSSYPDPCGEYHLDVPTIDPPLPPPVQGCESPLAPIAGSQLAAFGRPSSASRSYSTSFRGSGLHFYYLPRYIQYRWELRGQSHHEPWNHLGGEDRFPLKKTHRLHG